MKILLAPLLFAVSLPAFAGAHEECMKAVDYQGCFAARSSIKKPVPEISVSKTSIPLNAPAEYNEKSKPSHSYIDVVTPQAKLEYTSPCPPGKSLYQKRMFLGLIKLGKVCLSDYEAENLKQRERHRALDNFGNSMDSLVESMKSPRRINCNSTSYGNHTSTSCY